MAVRLMNNSSTFEHQSPHKVGLVVDSGLRHHICSKEAQT